MGTTRIKVASVAVCAIVLVFASAAIAAAAAGGYSVRPGEIDPKDPATRAYFKPVLQPGASATQHIVVTNLDAAPLHLLIDSVDGLTGQTSGSVYANRQDPVRKAGGWIAPATHGVTIGARGTATIAFTITVPRDATPGDHLAGIAFENTATNSSSGSFAVKQIIREVVGVLVRVPGPASEHLSIGSLALQSLPGTPFASVIVNLTNSGALLCKPQLSVALHGPNGLARTVTRQLDTILPGDTIAYPLPWPDSLAAGQYVARASTTGCGPALTTADVPLALGASLKGTQSAPQPATGRSHLPLLSMLFALGIALGGLIIGILLGKRRRRDEAPVGIPFEAYAVETERRVKLEAQHESHSLTGATNDPEQQSLWP